MNVLEYVKNTDIELLILALVAYYCATRTSIVVVSIVDRGNPNMLLERTCSARQSPPSYLWVMF